MRVDLIGDDATDDAVVQMALGPRQNPDNPVRMQVTDNIGQLTSLTSLSIVDCPLEELSSCISRLQNLHDLDLDCSFFPEVDS